MNQDPLGIQATCRKNCCSKGHFGGLYPVITCAGFQNSWQIWSGPLQNNDFVVVVINRYNHDIKLEFDWEIDAQVPKGVYKVQDLWTQEILGVVNTSKQNLFQNKLGFHDNLAFRLQFVQRVP